VAELLRRVRFAMAEPVDFARTDHEGVLVQVRVLTAAATYFNVLAVADFGGRAGAVRAPGLVEQVIGAALQSFGGQDPHQEPFARAAMLLRGITQGHPFNDGNKRTGFLVAAFYLRNVGYPLPDPLPEDEIYSMCLAISAGRIRDVAEIRAELERLWGRSVGRPEA
jgi:death-on-curing protein